MKTIFRIAAIAILFIGFMTSCNKDTTETIVTDNETLDYGCNAGDVFARELKVGDKVLIYSEEKMVNFGTEATKVLIPVNQKLDILDEDHNETFFVISEESIESFIEHWAEFRNLDTENVNDRVEAFVQLRDFCATFDIDMALMVNLIRTRSDISLRNLVNTIESTNQTRSSNVSHNTTLRNLYYNKDQQLPQTKGTADNIVKIFKGIVELGEIWYEFAKNSSPVVNTPDTFVSVLSSADTLLTSYTQGQYYKSLDYALSYWVLNEHHAQITYIVEGYYNSLNKNGEAGQFISECSVRSTHLDVKGAYHTDGSTNVAPYVNNKSKVSGALIPFITGSVEVHYGNRVTKFHSYLNFTVSGDTGYALDTYDSGM